MQHRRHTTNIQSRRTQYTNNTQATQKQYAGNTQAVRKQHANSTQATRHQHVRLQVVCAVGACRISVGVEPTRRQKLPTVNGNCEGHGWSAEANAVKVRACVMGCSKHIQHQAYGRRMPRLWSVLVRLSTPVGRFVACGLGNAGVGRFVACGLSSAGVGRFVACVLGSARVGRFVACGLGNAGVGRLFFIGAFEWGACRLRFRADSEELWPLRLRTSVALAG
eukprot:364198-Chlamydomonas_euryale.AAC.3